MCNRDDVPGHRSGQNKSRKVHGTAQNYEKQKKSQKLNKILF